VSLLYTGRTDSSLTSMNEFFSEGTFHTHTHTLFEMFEAFPLSLSSAFLQYTT